MSDDERERGMLTEADRKYLRAAEDEYSRQASHERERAIEARVVDSLLDFAELVDHTTPAEREKILSRLPTGHVGTNALVAAMAALYEAAGLRDFPFTVIVEEGIRKAIAESRESPPPGQILKVSTDFDVDIEYQPDKGPEVNSAIRTLLGGGDFDDLDHDELVDYLRWAERADSVAPEAVARERREFFESTLDGPAPEDVDTDQE